MPACSQICATMPSATATNTSKPPSTIAAVFSVDAIAWKTSCKTCPTARTAIPTPKATAPAPAQFSQIFAHHVPRIAQDLSHFDALVRQLAHQDGFLQRFEGRGRSVGVERTFGRRLFRQRRRFGVRIRRDGKRRRGGRRRRRRHGGHLLAMRTTRMFSRALVRRAQQLVAVGAAKLNGHTSIPASAAKASSDNGG